MQQYLQALQLVSEPNRFQIISILLHSNQDLCVNEIAEMIDSSPSSVSHHFAKLELAGLVCSYKIGRRVCYNLAENSLTTKIKQVIKVLAE